jgi:hypothetical protein
MASTSVSPHRVAGTLAIARAVVFTLARASYPLLFPAPLIPSSSAFFFFPSNVLTDATGGAPPDDGGGAHRALASS